LCSVCPAAFLEPPTINYNHPYLVAIQVTCFALKVEETPSLLVEMILSVLLKQWAVQAMRKLKVSCIGVYMSLELRRPEDGTSAPKHVGIFKPYLNYINLLCVFVGIYD